MTDTFNLTRKLSYRCPENTVELVMKDSLEGDNPSFETTFRSQSFFLIFM